MGYNGGKTLKERFDEKWSEKDECWIWNSRFNSAGQIRANTFSLNGKIMRAYRASFILHKGDIPEGAAICHNCDNPLCVNPDHLWVGSNAENTADMHNKRRANTPKGEQHSSAKLTEADVKAIRLVMSDAPRGAQKALALRYGISKSTIQDIRSGKIWKSVA
jgi:hypothetical protein